MLLCKKPSCGFFCSHPFCSMLLGAAVTAGAAVLLCLFRERLCRMAEAVGNCACQCADTCGDMVTKIRDDLEGKGSDGCGCGN